MTESRGELDLYNQWFILADADKDGVVSGGEAVQFFSKSGLPTSPTLYKVWQYVAGDRPSLNRREFYTAMKLVSLAQANNGVLDDQAALRLVNGLAGPVPPPRLAGLPIPPELASSAVGGVSSRPAPPSPIPASQPAGFVPLTPQQVGSFTVAFQQLDTDHDGLVQGVDCFGVFMRSGLPKPMLKTVWELVAGEAGALSAHQFVQALYLIEHAKSGRPLPGKLPPGQFPPVAAPVELNQLTTAIQRDIFSGAGLAAMPPRVSFGDFAQQQLQSVTQIPIPGVPSFPPAGLADISAAERARIEEEQRALEAKRAEAEAAEAARAAAAARAKFYTDALAELRLAGSGISRALVEAQQRAEMETAEADAAERDYDAAYADFTRRHAAAAPAVAAAQAAAEKRASLATRLEALRATVAELESAAAPGARARDEEEALSLERELTALTVRRAALEAAAGSATARRDALRKRRTELRAGADEAQAALGPLQGEVAALVSASEPDQAALIAAMRAVAPLYDTLYRLARGAMLPLPAEALAGLKREALPLTYDGLLAAGAAEWGSFDDKGFTIVSALPPDERLQTLAVTPTAAANAADADLDDGTATEDVAPVATLSTQDNDKDNEAALEEEAKEEANSNLGSEMDNNRFMNAEPPTAKGEDEQPRSPVPTPVDEADPTKTSNADDNTGILASAIAKALEGEQKHQQGKKSPGEETKGEVVVEEEGVKDGATAGTGTAATPVAKKEEEGPTANEPCTNKAQTIPPPPTLAVPSNPPITTTSETTVGDSAQKNETTTNPNGAPSGGGSSNTPTQDWHAF